MNSGVPFCAEELSTEWFTEALTRCGSVRSAKVSRFEVETFGAGTGFLSQLLRIHLRYNLIEPGAPSTLIAKFPSTSPSIQELALRTGMYFQEVSFYQELSDGSGIGTPRCYFAGVNDERASTGCRRADGPNQEVALRSRWRTGPNDDRFVVGWWKHSRGTEERSFRWNRLVRHNRGSWIEPKNKACPFLN